MMEDATQVAPRLRTGDRVAVLGVLAGLATLSWAYLLHMEWGMRHMDVGADMAIMPAMANWGFAGLCLVLRALLETALVTPMMNSASQFMSGLFLIGAGVFQFTPLKRACLTGCRSPVRFLLGAWQESRSGAFALWLKDGATCLGCCWALMLLPLALGVMNLLWMAALTGFILLEKAFPGGDRFGRTAGWALIFWGGLLLVRHFLS